MRIEQLLIALVIFGLVITTGFYVFQEQIVEYNLSADNSKLSGLRSQMNPTKDEDIEQNIREKVTGNLDPDEPTEDAMFKGGFTSIRDITKGTVRTANITNYVVQESGIFPGYVGTGFKIIISILATAFLIYMVLRFMPQK